MNETTEVNGVNALEYRHKLGYAIKAHGEEITELVFREPTGADIVRSGNPLRLNYSMDEAAMENQMVALASVPPSTIRQLKAKDWNIIAFELCARFFAPVRLATDERPTD
jgi:hypothetical protein